MNQNMNYYEILGVKENATSEEIKTAYKTQMKKWHPDINKSTDAINMSAKINEAKEVLLDDVKRKDYDEYLKNKIDEEYNRYTQRKQASTASNNSDTNKPKEVTKWQYLKDWLKYSNVSKLRKAFGIIGVILESFLCFIIKSILIVLSFFCYILSDMIRIFYSYLISVIGIIVGIFIIMCFINGINETINDNITLVRGLIVIGLIYVSSFILPLLGNLLLSKKIFNILYNKIDVNLFKKCVGIK